MERAKKNRSRGTNILMVYTEGGEGEGQILTGEGGGRETEVILMGQTV